MIQSARPFPLLLTASLLCSACEAISQDTGSGLCVVEETQEINDIARLRGSSFSVGDTLETHFVPYDGTVTWVQSGATESVHLDVEKVGVNLALVYNDPEACGVDYLLEAEGGIDMGTEGRIYDHEMTGSFDITGEAQGTLKLTGRFALMTGLRAPQTYQAGDFDKTWVELELSRSGDRLVGDGLWRSGDIVDGDVDPMASEDCCEFDMLVEGATPPDTGA